MMGSRVRVTQAAPFFGTASRRQKMPRARARQRSSVPAKNQGFIRQVNFGGTPSGHLPGQSMRMAASLTLLIGPPGPMNPGAFGELKSQNAFELPEACSPFFLRVLKQKSLEQEGVQG